MLWNFPAVWERDFHQNRGNIGAESCQGRLTKNFPKNCINRLFSITHLVLCADYFMMFIAEFCLLVF